MSTIVIKTQTVRKSTQPIKMNKSNQSVNSVQTIKSNQSTQKVIKSAKTNRSNKSNKSIKLSNSEYAEKYAENNFVPFTLNILTDNNGKKLLRNVPKFSTIDDDNYMNYVIDDMNGMAIRMGLEVEEDFYVVLIDIDNKEDTETVLNGLTKWNELIKRKRIETPIQKSGNDGLHYLFKVSQEVFETLPASITELTIDKKKYSIDFKGKNQFVIVAPSNYDGKYYEWKNDFTMEIQEMPQWLLDLIINHKRAKNSIAKICSNKNTKKEICNNKKSNPDNDNVSYIDIDSDDSVDSVDSADSNSIDSINEDYDIDNIRKLLGMLSLSRADNYDEWLAVGMAIHDVTEGHGLVHWNEWSKNSKKYKKTTCTNKWTSFRNNNNRKPLTIGSIIHWCKLDNPEEYNKYRIKRKNDEIIIKKYPDMNLELGNTIEINDRKCTILNNDTCFFIQNVHEDMKKPMFVDIHNGIMEIKCRHMECLGKTCPYPSIKLTKNEMNVIHHGTMNVTINNYNGGESNALMEFPRFDIFDDVIINNLIFNSLNGSHATMADIIYYYFKDKYTYGEDNKWYCYENHRWHFIGTNNHKFSLEIEEKLKDIYQTMINYGKDNKIDNDKINELKKIRKSFDISQTKDCIMKVTKERFQAKNNPKNDFIKNINANNHLIVFENGIYDLKDNTFRDGKFTDNMSMCVGYDYISKHTEKYSELMSFLSDIQPNDDELDFLLTYISLSLYGNILEWFTILTGEGRNGKSKFIELLKKTFGDFFGSVKSQLFTRSQPDAQSPDPGLLSIRRKKLIVSSEPEKNSKLNSGFIKFLTGRDSIELRDCHSNQMIEFDPKFITLFVCNDIPDIDVIDKAFSKRLRCIY